MKPKSRGTQPAPGRTPFVTRVPSHVDETLEPAGWRTATRRVVLVNCKHLRPGNEKLKRTSTNAPKSRMRTTRPLWMEYRGGSGPAGESRTNGHQFALHTSHSAAGHTSRQHQPPCLPPDVQGLPRPPPWRRRSSPPAAWNMFCCGGSASRDMATKPPRHRSSE